MKEFETSTAFSNNKETHSHIHSINKDGKPLEWQPLYTEEELHIAAQNGGSYYLAKDIDLTRELEIIKDMNLCLNDKVLKQTVYMSRVIYVRPAVIFNLCDCSGENGTTRYWDKGCYGLWVLRTDDSISEYRTVGGVITSGSNVRDGGGVYNDGILIMYGGNITGNSVGVYGGGVFNYGTFIMHGGSITGNSSTNGAVSNRYNATFTMYGGTITGNSATYGGGVSNYGEFTMHGGTITENIAKFGGGVKNSKGATLTMNGGEITGNSGAKGGGILNEGTFTINSGSVVGNTAAEHGDNI